MTDKAGAQKPSDEAHDGLAFSSFYEMMAWLVAASGGLYSAQYMLTRQFSGEGPGMHPLSFVFFALAFISLNCRHFRLFPAFIRARELLLSRLITVLLAAFIVLRLAEAVVGSPIGVLTLIGGDAFGSTGYSSWPTALCILLLFSMATYCPKPAPRVLRLTSYLLFWFTVLFCVHQMLHWTGMSQGGSFRLAGVSGPSAFALLCLAGVVLPHSAVWDILFDTRTHRSNLLSAGIVLVALGITTAEATLLDHMEIVELGTFALLLSLIKVAPWARGRELAALERAGRLTPEGALITEKPPSAMRPLPDIERRGLSKLVYDTIFVKPLWVSDLWYAALIAAVALGAMVLSRTGDGQLATFWPVNALLGYWLIITPMGRWARVLSYFYVTLLSVNLIMDNPLAASAMLTVVNAFEAVTATLVFRTVLGMFVKDRLVHITRVTIPTLLTATGASVLSLLGLALLGGIIIRHFFGGSLLANSWTWFNGSALGWLPIMPISVGILMEMHWGYPKLKSILKPFWLVLPGLCLAFWGGLQAHFLESPVVLFVALSSLGVFLPSLWQAGTVVACLNIILSYWLHFNSAFNRVSPQGYSVILFMLCTVILGVFILRKTQARMERELDLIAIEGPSNTVILDAAGNIVSSTERLAELVGQKRAELIGQNLMDVLQVTAQAAQDVPTLPPLRESIWACAPSGNLATRGVEIITTETSDRTMPFTYICAIRDRSETLRAEEARVAQIERNQAIILTQDENWNIVHCSDGWCEAMGYSREETTGQDLQVFFANDETRAHARAMRGERPSDQSSAIIDDTTNYELRTKSGDIRLIKIRALYTGHHPDVVTATLQDVTEEVTQRRAKEHVQEIAEAFLSDGLTYFSIEDSEYKTVAHSDAVASDFFGKNANELVGRDPIEFYPQTIQDEIWKRRAEEKTELDKHGKITIEYSTELNGKVGLRHLRCHIKRINRSDGKYLNAIVTEDITELVSKSEALEAALKNAEGLLDAGTSAYTVVDEAFNRVLVSETARELFGLERDGILDAPYISHYKNLSEEERLAQLAQIKALETGVIWHAPGVDVFDTPDGRTIYVRRSCRWFPSPTGGGRLLWTNLDDVTELHAAQEARERALGQAKSILSAGVTLFAIQDEEFKLQFMSKTLMDLFEIKHWDEWNSLDATPEGEDQQSLHNKLAKLPLGKAFNTTIKVNTLKTHRVYTLSVSARWYIDAEGKRMLGLAYNDITALRAREAQLEEQARLLKSQAETDTLTGALNRLGIDKHMEVDERGRRERDLAIYLLDLDFFKSVNDTYSHSVGDDLLKAVANTLQECAHAGDVVGRLGGEEFFIATPWLSKEETLAFGERLREGVATTTIFSDGHELSRTVSIGATQMLRHEDFGQRLHLADIALTDAKAEGRNRVVMADTAYTQKKHDAGAFITELDIVAGLEKREFLYYVQPIFNTSSQRIEGFEALVRWQKPDGTLIPPGAFVDRFHKVFYRPEYLETRQEMRREILRALRGFPNTYVSWNFELEQFGDDSFIQSVLATSAELHDITGQSFVLEISEHAMTARVDMERIIPNLERLRNAGLKIALDDFGIEQSNIHRLSQLPIDIVKLDKSLVDRIETSEKDRATMRALSLLLNNLKIVAIAEGVETHAQSRLLHYARVYHQQGYLHARPMLPKEVQAKEPNIGYNPQMVGSDAMHLFLDRKRELNTET